MNNHIVKIEHKGKGRPRSCDIKGCHNNAQIKLTKTIDGTWTRVLLCRFHLDFIKDILRKWW
jgi:hypothetical protein